MQYEIVYYADGTIYRVVQKKRDSGKIVIKWEIISILLFASTWIITVYIVRSGLIIGIYEKISKFYNLFNTMLNEHKIQESEKLLFNMSYINSCNLLTKSHKNLILVGNERYDNYLSNNVYIAW